MKELSQEQIEEVIMQAIEDAGEGDRRGTQYRKEQKYSNQYARAKKFPSDRICFLQSKEAADEDRHIFEAYRKGTIKLEEAIRRMADNNCLFKVTKAQFLNEYIICGWGWRNEKE